MNGLEDYRSKLIAIAERIATEGATDNRDFLRRFRTVYRHLVMTVDGTAHSRMAWGIVTWPFVVAPQLSIHAGPHPRRTYLAFQDARFRRPDLFEVG